MIAASIGRSKSEMPQDQFYRYFSHSAEWEQLHRDRLIKSTNPYGGGRS